MHTLGTVRYNPANAVAGCMNSCKGKARHDARFGSHTLFMFAIRRVCKLLLLLLMLMTMVMMMSNIGGGSNNNNSNTL